MSARNTLEAKRLRKGQRMLRTKLPAYIDLVEWIKLRSSVTTNTAHQLLLAGVLRVDSHRIGVTGVKGRQTVDRFVPASYRGRITIHTPEKK